MANWRMGLLAVAIGLLGLPRDGAQAGEVKPNFVIINCDDLGYADIGPFGSKLNRTPNLDRMAAEGRRFTSFYGAPVCSPSRSSLMTGCYPKRVGIPVVLFPAGSTGISAEEHTLAELLKQQGYATMCIGKWHLGDQPQFLPTRHGFDHYFGIPYSNDMGPAADGARSSLGDPLPEPREGKKGKPATNHPPLPLLRDEQVVQRLYAEDQTTLVARYTAEALKFIESRRQEPFFLYLPHTAVHFPIYPGKAFQGRSGNGIYGDWVEELDWSTGQILDALRNQGLADNTLVVFTSDNGGTPRAVNAPLRGFKASTFEGGMREPTIFWWPGKIPPGTATDEIGSMMDLLPTLVGLAGGRVPQDRPIDGVDLWPVVSGQPRARSPREAFYYFRNNELQAVRSGTWKLETRSGVLYDLANDIGESTNVAQEHPAVVERLRALAARAAADLGDKEPGPGCRAAGHVSNPQPIIDHDGTIRAEFRP